LIADSHMPNWQGALVERVKDIIRPRTAGDNLAGLRLQFDRFTNGFGAPPAEIVFEGGQVGPVKGEWARLPEPDSRRLILYFHGGGYISGSPQTHRPLVGRLCLSAQAAAFVPTYRLGPEFGFPAGLRDCIDIYRNLIQRGVEPQSIALAGDEAGGGLAFALLLAIRNGGLPMPACCVAMSPWADMSLSGWSILQNAKSDATLSWQSLFLCARHYLKKSNPADPYASPAFAPFRDFPPIMVHAGSLEILRDDASRIGERAAEAGIAVSVEIYDRMQHLFQANPSLPEARVSLERLGKFVMARTQDATRGFR
jgi:epsilon-lactone hydrolase